MEDEADASREREKVLKFWNLMCGAGRQESREIDVAMLENTTVTAKLNSTDAKQTTFGVSELKTPLGTYPNAVLRQEDIVHMEIKLTPSDLQYLLNV